MGQGCLSSSVQVGRGGRQQELGEVAVSRIPRSSGREGAEAWEVECLELGYKRTTGLFSTEVRKASVCTAGHAGCWLCILQSSWSLEGLCAHH